MLELQQPWGKIDTKPVIICDDVALCIAGGLVIKFNEFEVLRVKTITQFILPKRNFFRRSKTCKSLAYIFLRSMFWAVKTTPIQYSLNWDPSV